MENEKRIDNIAGKMMSACTLCPRECHVDRSSEKKRFLRDGWDHLSGKSSTAYVGGTLYFRNKRFRNGILFRMRAALLFLSES